jgi:methylphosphotriester-DNA--protein-cysteine methyltransferase
MNSRCTYPVFSGSRVSRHFGRMTEGRTREALLKNSDLPITNVALDLSYADANYFCKAFKKEVGISPSEYRRRFQKHVDGAGNVETAT